ncbi:metallophosphoesterase family protein [Cohnella hongkongensis]|uniref:Metallophosphoesterase family protein n=1 Tax=Cohnella hongkongensis TaxID=178337 RepID=A0ABV9F8J7_9BACL
MRADRIEGGPARPLLSFQVITDTHVTADPQHVHNRNLERALLDISENAEDSCGIMHVGDVTDHGFPEEYEELARIWRSYGERLPRARFATGNHDMALTNWEARLSAFLAERAEGGGVPKFSDATASGEREELQRLWEQYGERLSEMRLEPGERGSGPEDWETKLGRFLEATGMPGPYHAHRIEGYLFLFLGTEKGLELFCSLSEEQLAWLDAQLVEETASGRPAFVFLHQPLKNTVAGSRESQRWYGVEQDEQLRRLLARHPRAIVFTGHTHWELEAEGTFYDGEDGLPPMFNSASVGYLWTDEDEHKDGSQGYYVEVYPDRVRVRGRDFERGAWIEAAQFEVLLASGE